MTTSTDQPAKQSIRYADTLWLFANLPQGRVRSLAPRPFIRLLRGVEEHLTWREIAVNYWRWADLRGAMGYAIQPFGWRLLKLAARIQSDGNSEDMGYSAIYQSGRRQGEEYALWSHHARRELAHNDLYNERFYLRLTDKESDLLAAAGRAIRDLISTVRDELLAGETAAAAAAIRDAETTLATDLGADWTDILRRSAAAHAVANAELAVQR